MDMDIHDALRSQYLAALAMLTGWTLLGAIFSGNPRVAEEMKSHQSCSWLALTALVPNQPSLPDPDAYVGAARFDSILQRSSGPMLGTWEELSRPFRKLVWLST